MVEKQTVTLVGVVIFVLLVLMAGFYYKNSEMTEFLIMGGVALAGVLFNALVWGNML